MTMTMTTTSTSTRYAPLGDRVGGSVLPFATASKGVVPIEDAASLAQRLLVFCRFVSFRGDPAQTTGVEVRCDCGWGCHYMTPRYPYLTNPASILCIILSSTTPTSLT